MSDPTKIQEAAFTHNLRHSTSHTLFLTVVARAQFQNIGTEKWAAVPFLPTTSIISILVKWKGEKVE